MSNELYFATIDNNVVFRADIIKAYFLKTGIKIDYDDVDRIRLVAASMAGINRELKRPSPVFLVKHGHTLAAVRVYRDIHECSLSEAKSIIDKMVEEFKEEM